MDLFVLGLLLVMMFVLRALYRMYSANESMKTTIPDNEKPVAVSGVSQEPLGRLSAHYEQLLEDMQAPESKASVEKLFTISGKADTDRSAQS